MPKNYIKMDEQHEPDILKELKTETFRYGWKTIPNEGDHVKAINSDTGEAFAILEITNISTITIQECVEQDFEGHVNYESVEEAIEQLGEYYTKEKLTPQTELIYIQFELHQEIDN